MITPFANSNEPSSLTEQEELYPRRGAGGSGAGGGHGGRGGGGSRNRNSTSPTPTAPPGTYPGKPDVSYVPRTPVPFLLNGKELSAIPFGGGTRRSSKGCFSKPHPFAERSCGGGTRDGVYGNSIYGSGYPGQTERGVEGRGFPYFFHPIVFPAGNGPDYLYREGEYGYIEAMNRPGGPLFQLSVHAGTTSQSTPPYKFHIVADKATTRYLLTALTYTCNRYNAAPGFTVDNPIPYVKKENSTAYFPVPQDVVQYYRASSVALVLEGYNNTDAVFDLTNTSISLPARILAPNISSNFVDCVNHTIGMTVPLVGGAVPRAAPNDFHNGVCAGLLSVFVIWVSICSWVL